MLHELHIAGLGVIEDLDLEPHRGLTVLTGETGTGKTMVAVGLSLALGARASGQQVRAGAGALRVQARFDPFPGHLDGEDDGDLVLARTVRSDGKGSARIGGQIVSVRELSDVGSRLVEVHGQHQTLRLLEPSTQTAFMDRFAGRDHVQMLSRCQAAATHLREVVTALERLREDTRERARTLDLLAYQVREIEDVGPGRGETARLVAEEARLGHVERLQELAGVVQDALAGEGAATDRLAVVEGGLSAAAALDPGAADLDERARSLAAETAELARDVRAYREALAADPGRLQQVRERVATLHGLQRKYGDDDAAVLAFLADARERLSALAAADERVEELEAEARVATADLNEIAAAVTAGRKAAIAPLTAALSVELEALGMPQAAIEVVLSPADAPGPGGAEHAEVRFSGGPGQPSRALTKVVSGGELSRVMLACRSVLADLDEVPTLVFDEIDAGIGGQAGLAVGARLARLASARQVVVVTHLPQIACFADRHVRVRKVDGMAGLDVLGEDARVQELSRMLAGLEGSEHARSHAEELLAEAAALRAGSEAALR